MARALITMQRSARRGEVIEIRTLISHPMESGHRADSEGRLLAVDIIRRFTVRYDGDIVFSAELFPAIAAYPYLAFFTTATTSGPLVFTWEGDHGFRQTETVDLAVTR